METISLFITVAIITGIVFPAFAIYGGNKLRKILQNHPERKIGMFKATAFQLSLLALLTLVPFWLDKIALTNIGLGFVSSSYSVIGLLLLSLLGWFLFRRLKMNAKIAQNLYHESKEILHILPTNQREYNWMIFVSFVAGICEEIVYRGFLFWFLLNYMPLIPAVILTNLPFALGHLTSTGVKNTIKTYILGLVFSGAFLLTESLWLPILLHILVDLYATNLTYKAAQQIENKGIIEVPI